MFGKNKKNKKESSLAGISASSETTGKKSGKKERLKDAQDELPPPAEVRKEERNKYYFSRSSAFNIARYVTIGVILIVFIVMFTVFSDIFTAENFKYLLKHLDMNSSGSEGGFESIYYSSTGSTRFVPFQGDVAVISPGEIKVFDHRGALSLNSTNEAANPHTAVSSKYIVLYDRGDSDYYVYNSLSLLLSKNAGGKIVKCAASESGAFAVMMTSGEYSTLIQVFNENFELISEIKRQNPVTDLALSDDGRFIAISGISISEAEVLTELCVFNLKTSTLEKELKISGEMPLRVLFTDEDTKSEATEEDDGHNKEGYFPALALLSDVSLRRVDTKETLVYNIEKSERSFFDIDGSRFVYSVRCDHLGENSKLVEVSLGSCKEEKSIVLKSDVDAITISGDDLFVITENTIVRTDFSGKDFVKEREGADGVIPLGGHNALVYGDGRAIYSDFSVNADDE